MLEKSDKMTAAPEQFTGFMVNSAKEWNKFTKEKVYSALPTSVIVPLKRCTHDGL
jgi:hypothetical protein